MRFVMILAGALLAGTGARAAPTPQGVQPDVELLEAAGDGMLTQGELLAATFAVTAPRGGTLEVFRTLPGSTDVVGQLIRVKAAPSDAARIVEVAFTEPATNQVALAWRLTERGTRVAAGTSDLAWGVDREGVLWLTTIAGPGMTREPARAPRTLQALVHHEVTVVSAVDFLALAPASRQALLDAAALGMVLVLDEADDRRESFPPGFEPLAAPEALAWQHGSDEIREMRFGSGLIRATTLGACADRIDGRTHLQDLLLGRQPCAATRLAHETGSWYSLAPSAGESASILPPPWGLGRLRFVLAVAALALLAPTTLLLACSRRGSRAWRSVTLAATGTLAASPVVGHLVLQAQRTPAFMSSTSRLVHHARDAVDERHGITKLTCGSATSAAGIAFDAGERSVATSGFDEAVLVHEGATRRILEPARLLPTARRQVTLEEHALEPGTRSWDVDLRWESGRMSGTARARRSFRRAILVAGHRPIPLGAVAAGDVIDVGARLRDRVTDRAGPALTGDERHALASAFRISRDLWRERRFEWLWNAEIVLVGILDDARSAALPIDAELRIDIQEALASGALEASGGWVGAVVRSEAHGDGRRIVVPDALLRHAAGRPLGVEGIRGSYRGRIVLGAGVGDRPAPASPGFTSFPIPSDVRVDAKCVLAWRPFVPPEAP